MFLSIHDSSLICCEHVFKTFEEVVNDPIIVNRL